MSEGWLRVNNLGKAYRHYASEWHRVGSWFGIPVTPKDEQWVLRNVSFNVEPGEAVGIVGQNGAGKSTLLKLITGTLKPNEGNVEISGRVAAILELGMGFNHEFTGRQNASHALGLMGFSVAEIAAVMPQIESFAEVGEYFEQPVRTYSSGMQMRVAFATATVHQPEILIVDEALSVGDTYFQHKSFRRIKEVQDQGTTLLIVSHDKSAISVLCSRAILLEKGFVIKDGNPESVMDFYNALIAEKENKTLQVVGHESGKAQTISGTGEARIEKIAMFNAMGERVECINVGEAVELRVHVRVYSAIPRLVLGYVIKDRLGQYVYGTNTHHTNQQLENLMPGQIFQYQIQFAMNIGPGSYSISTALVSSETHLVNNYEWKDLALLFSICNFDKPIFVGNAWLPPAIEIKSE